MSGRALFTDLYQIAMAAGYFEAGKTRERATFELFARELPPNRSFILAAGLEQAVEYLLNLRFAAEEIAYLRTLPQLKKASAAFFKALADFRFTGDLFAVPEGTPLFAGEPFLTVRAPIMEAQIPETYLLSTIGFQSLIATKAARVVKAAAGRGVVEFGSRRAHSPEAGVLAGRAAYVGGCEGTSNVESGLRYGIPVFGTCAHSWVQSFTREREAFVQLQKLLGETTAYIIDTYDTINGACHVAELGRPLWGVRLDSGNLDELSRQVRKILDDAGLPGAKIMATGDLDEFKIRDLAAAGAPIDSFGVGTALAVSSDAPALGVVYKMVEIEDSGQRRYTLKLSADKITLPGAKQIFRYSDRDVLARSSECPSC
ncbi:MAG: nicotinate phosphoribosyltransferase, partial [Bryobacteraceae bacterium]